MYFPIQQYTCPDIDTVSAQLQEARNMCKPATADNPADNEGWFNNLTENPPNYYQTPYLCVFDQLGMVKQGKLSVDKDTLINQTFVT